MSMIAIPFAIDLDKLLTVFGSNDNELLLRAKTTKMYKVYSDQQQNYSYDKALEDIIFRPNSLNRNAGHVYGYALMAISDVLGEHLLPSCDGFYYGRDWETAKEIVVQSGLTIDIERMFEAKNVFPIPVISDFPVINYFTKMEVNQADAQLYNVIIDEDKANIENEDFDEVQEYLLNIRTSFRKCWERNVELVTFMH